MHDSLEQSLPPPIIQSGRGLSPLRLSPFPSPHFQQPSPVPADAPSGVATPPHTLTTPSGILINKTLSHPTPHAHTESPSPLPSPSATETPPSGPAAAGILPAVGLGIGASLPRVGSPDGSASEASVSDWSNGSTSTAPSSAVGSPEVKAALRSQSPTDSLATLSLLTAADSLVAAEVRQPVARLSRSQSPHCHFAPLPKVEQQERPGTRRNSNAERNPLASRMRMSTADSPEEPFSMEPVEDTQGPASILASSLLSMNPTVTFRPAGRRSSSSAGGRSPSPSPSRRSGSAQSSNRSHSPPPLSRHASQDAMHLHFIASRDRSRDRDRDDANPSSGRASPLDASRAPFAEAPVPDRGIVGRCRPALTSRSRTVVDGGVEREVVEVAPTDADDDQEEDLDEVEEEDENEDDEDDEEKPAEEEDASHVDDEDEDEEVPEPEAARSKTARGAGVEVVHWHRDEVPEGDQTPTPVITATTAATATPGA